MRSIISIFLLSILAACAPATPLATATPSLTPSLTLQPTRTRYPLRTPTPSLTPFPTFTPSATRIYRPLTEHKWNPETVLIQFSVDLLGDGGGDIYVPPPPLFILYADGSLFVSQEDILFKKLDNKEVCQILNTLDQIGYFDYDPASYDFIGSGPIVKGARGSTSIEINAWKSHKGFYAELGYYLEDELTGRLAKELQQQGYDISKREGWPVIAPELRNAYYFLSEYPIENFEVYQPERLGVWMLQIDSKFLDSRSFYSVPQEWTVKKSLIAMFESINTTFYTQYTVLGGEEARMVYKYLEQFYGTAVFYEENIKGEKEYFLVSERPLLPYEQLDDYSSQIAGSDIPKPNFTLTCYPSDGILPIPTPSIP